MPAPACPNCGYDTRGLPAALCPECGAVIPETAPSRPSRRLRASVFIVAVLTTGALGYVQSILPGVPRWWGPLPLTVIVPAFLLSEKVPSALIFLAVLPITGVAALVAAPIAFGVQRIRWWLAAPVVGIAALSAWYMASTMGIAIGYYPHFYVYFCLAANVVFVGALASLYALNRRHSSFASAAVFFVLVCLWLASYAFPYLSELP